MSSTKALHLLTLRLLSSVCCLQCQVQFLHMLEPTTIQLRNTFILNKDEQKVCLDSANKTYIYYLLEYLFIINFSYLVETEINTG